jgi:hypothetical protein
MIGALQIASESLIQLQPETAMITKKTATTATIGVLAVLGALMVCNVTAARAAQSPDACSILTESAVGAALGASVTVWRTGSDATHCHWQQQDSHGRTVVDARLMTEAARTYDAAKNMMGMSGKVTRVAVTGVGQDAYYLVGAHDAPLFAKKGDVALRVAVDGKGLSMEDIKSKEKALALALLGKL